MPRPWAASVKWSWAWSRDPRQLLGGISFELGSTAPRTRQAHSQSRAGRRGLSGSPQTASSPPFSAWPSWLPGKAALAGASLGLVLHRNHPEKKKNIHGHQPRISLGMRDPALASLAKKSPRLQVLASPGLSPGQAGMSPQLGHGTAVIWMQLRASEPRQRGPPLPRPQAGGWAAPPAPNPLP